MAKRGPWTGPPPIFCGPALAGGSDGEWYVLAQSCPRAQTFLWALASTLPSVVTRRKQGPTVANTVSTVSSVRDDGSANHVQGRSQADPRTRD
jgi:hypothetical protein